MGLEKFSMSPVDCILLYCLHECSGMLGGKGLSLPAIWSKAFQEGKGDGVIYLFGLHQTLPSVCYHHQSIYWLKSALGDLKQLAKLGMLGKFCLGRNLIYTYRYLGNSVSSYLWDFVTQALSPSLPIRLCVKQPGKHKASRVTLITQNIESRGNIWHL